IFVGSFENAGTFHRVATIIACTAIVITAVYILRVVGKILFQAIPNKKFYELHDATWDERFSIGALIFCVAGLGLFPLFFENMIIDAVHPIFDHIITYVPNLGNL
ncbi:MAG: NADH-quinone oxidoreductase subunit M, partial [Prevotella fusca]